jgi:parallel beta-helix repeat protein
MRRGFSFILVIFLLFAPSLSWAATYHVSPTTGSDSVSCPTAQQWASHPGRAKRTVNGALPCLRPGDTLAVHAGAYNELVNVRQAGTSWTSPITITPYGADRVRFSCLNVADGPRWLVIEGKQHQLSIDGTGTNLCAIGVQLNSSVHGRLRNVEVTKAQHSGISSGKNISDWQFINLNVDGNGTKPAGPGLAHGIYTAFDGMLIDGGRYCNHKNGYGIQLRNAGLGFNTSNITVRNVEVCNNTSGGMVVVGGSGHKFYNNRFWNNRWYGVLHAASNSLLYSNLFHGNQVGLEIQLASHRNNTVRNNLFSNNSDHIRNNGTGTIFSDNCCTSSDIGCDEPVGPIPFVDAAAVSRCLDGNSISLIDAIRGRLKP